MIKGFVKSEKVGEVLNAAHKSGQNVILYGPGGYGKSEMSTAFLRQIGARKDQVTIKSLSVGSSVDDLFGGINMKTLQEEGVIEYNLDHSIFSTPYLVLEEAFDAPLRVLEAMKDTLTSGWVRNGAQQWQVKTKFIIVCTNRSKEELIEDESSKALMERFPLSLKVYWDSHKWADYRDLIEVVSGDVPDTIEVLIKYMLKSIEEDESKLPPPPRTVVRMVNVFKAAGVSGLKYMDGLPNIDRAIVNMEGAMIIARRKKEFEKEVNSLESYSRTFTDQTPYYLVKDHLHHIESLTKFDSSVGEEQVQEAIAKLSDMI